MNLNTFKKTTRKETQYEALHAQIKVLLAAHPEIKREMLRIPKRYRDATTGTTLASITVHYGATFYLSITLRNLTSLKTDKRLLKLLELYAGDEWAAETDDYTYGNVPERSFKFTRRTVLLNFFPEHLYARAGKIDTDLPSTLLINVQIAALVAGDSTSCRLVTTGKKEIVRIEDVKEIVCV